MGLKAVGEYLRLLREHRGFSLTDLAAMVATSASQIWRIENAKSETRLAQVAQVCVLVGGEWEHIFTLLQEEKDSIELAHRLAEQVITQVPPDPSSDRMSLFPEVQSMAKSLSDFELGKWVAAGERIISERSRPK
jgi:transcriptional regulator with XRE-family HTH domain